MEDWIMEGFGFAFNDSAFSDRILRIEIISDDPSPPKKKQCPSVNASLESNDSVTSSCVGAQVKTLHISSPILAAKSPFFYKLFKNEMKESQQSEVTLTISSSEEAALVDIINFMYNNTLSATICSALLDVLMVADKYLVSSCVRYCIELLLKMPMSLESALLYLELPPTVLRAQPLIDASKEYLVAHFRDFNKSYEEALELPLCAVEIVLGSEGLQVNSEDDVFGFILDWGHKHYPNLNERREIIATQLVKFICFPYMSYSELQDILIYPEINIEQISKLVIEALIFKAKAPHGQHIHAPKHLTTSKTSFPRRIYNCRPVQVLHLEFPWPRCVIYFDLTKDECGNLFPSDMLLSESFLLGGQWFYLVADCTKDEPESLLEHFGLFVQMREGSETCTLDIEVAVITKSLKEFECQTTDKNLTVTENMGSGWCDLFDIPWTAFMSDDSEYFINGIMHLRVDLTLTNICQT